jgi:hypothetical protein
MITVRQKAALATAAFLALGTFATQALANQPNSGGTRGPTHGAISGTISFPESYLPHGFNSKACRDFSVVAEMQSKHQPKLPKGVLNLDPRMTVEGTSGRLTGTLDGNTVECAYSIQDLSAGQFTVQPSGESWGYKGGGGGEEALNPVSKIVVLNRYGLDVAEKSNVDFSLIQISQPK